MSDQLAGLSYKARAERAETALQRICLTAPGPMSAYERPEIESRLFTCIHLAASALGKDMPYRAGHS